MIPLAIFPCRFTDSARIIGELSYTLSMPVYTDQMILQEMSDQLNVTIDNLQKRLFGWTRQTSSTSIEKGQFAQMARNCINNLQTSSTDYLYFGFFMSLINQSDGLTHRLLIHADENLRVQRGMRQEQLTELKARGVIQEHDRKALCWSRFLFDRDPYDPALFDTIIRYEHQDLFDVVAYICLLFENHILQKPTQSSCNLCLA